MTAPLTDAEIAEIEANESLPTRPDFVWTDEYIAACKDRSLLLAEVRRLRGELDAVDQTLARRSALDNLPGRLKKIAHAIATASRADAAEAQNKRLAEALREALNEWADTAQYKCEYLLKKHGDMEQIKKMRAILTEQSTP